MAYAFLRINLSEKRQQDLWDSRFPSRESYIRHVFGERFEFAHDSRNWIFEPLGEYGSVLAGFIGGETRRETREGPDTGWQHVEHEHWTTHNVFIDPSEHKDGQKIAFGLGKIKQVEDFFGSICDAINERYKSVHWLMQIGTIGRQVEYEEAASRYKGKIKKLRFKILARNMDYRIDKKVKDSIDLWSELELDYAEHEAVSQSASIDAVGDFAKQVATYAQESGGRVQLFDEHGNEQFDSKRTNETANIDQDVDIDSETPKETIERLILQLLREFPVD